MTGREATAPPRRRTSLLGWTVFALLVLLVLVLGRAALPQTVGEQARRQFEAKLQSHYVGLDVSIDRGRYESGVGFVFEGVHFRNAGNDSPPSLYERLTRKRGTSIASIDRMTVVADLDWDKLTAQQNPMLTKRVVIDGGEINLQQDDDQRWSVQSLFPMPTFGPVCPRMDIRGVRLRLVDAEANDRVVETTLDHAIIEASVGSDQTVSKKIRLVGHSPFARRIEVSAKCEGDDTSVVAKLQTMSLHRGLLDRLPRRCSSLLNDLQGLACVADVELTAVRRTKQNQPATSRPSTPIEATSESISLADTLADWNLRGSVTVQEGRFTHPLLPMPIEQIRAKATVDQRGLQLETSQAKFGDAICRVGGQLHGLTWPVKADLHLVTDGLLIDDRIASAVPAKFRSAWDRLRPAGRIDVDALIGHEDGVWTKSATLTCKGLDVRFDKFPYPVTQLTGLVTVRDDRAFSNDVRGRIGPRQIQCQFDMPIKPKPTDGRLPEPFRFQCQTDDAIPIDEALLSSLTPRGATQTGLERFVRSLDCGGSFHLISALVNRDALGVVHRDIDLRVSNGRLTYDKFRYPLFDVHGGIQVNDDIVHVTRFEAAGASGGLILCDGTYQMPTLRSSESANSTPLPAAMIGDLSPVENKDDLDDGSRLDLVFRASDVPMDDSLRSALPATSRSTWDALSPAGVLDRLTVQVRRQGTGPLKLGAEAHQSKSDVVESRTLSLRPTAVPYRLDVMGGTVQFDGESVRISEFEGRHGGSRLAAKGQCRPYRGGRWVLELEILSGSRLDPDADLISSLPGPMTNTMRRLQFREPVNLRGLTRVLLPDAPDVSPIIDWNVTMQLEGNRIGDVGPVHSLRGELTTFGRHDGQKLLAAGDISLDSMHVHQLQITNLRGPFSIEDDRLRMGQRVRPLPGIPDTNPTANQVSTPIRGALFDGSFDVNGIANLSASEFQVSLSIDEAKVPILLADLGYDDQGLTGTIDGSALVAGVLGDMERLEGNGEASMTGANIYQLPLIIQIFNQLSIKPTEAVAITDGDCRFSLDGRDINFSPLRLWGDLVALYGGGRVTRAQDLDLSFDTRVSPQNAFTKVFAPLRTQPYTLWTIDVVGPIGAQTIQRRALDNFGDTLERLFPAMAGSTSPSEPPPSSRNALNAASRSRGANR